MTIYLSNGDYFITPRLFFALFFIIFSGVCMAAERNTMLYLRAGSELQRTMVMIVALHGGCIARAGALLYHYYFVWVLRFFEHTFMLCFLHFLKIT